MPKTVSTRDRVIETCRKLFNERGPVAVTTAEIAATVGINEGNLYYYFKTKEQMLMTLFERFEQALAALDPPATETPADPWAPHIERLERFFDLVWNWRFLYRDGLALATLAPSLRDRITAHAAETQADLEQRVRGMVAAGLLTIPESKIAPLAINVWIVLTYWVQYLQHARGVTRITKRHLAEGHEQVRALYLPYVTRDPALAAAATD